MILATRYFCQNISITIPKTRVQAKASPLSCALNPHWQLRLVQLPMRTREKAEEGNYLV